MNSLYSIFISILSFLLVMLISFVLDNTVFTEPKKSEDKLLTFIKLLIEISIICIVTFLIISNINEISGDIGLENQNQLLIPTIIIWILVINYYFKNKIFGKFDILFNSLYNNNLSINNSNYSIGNIKGGYQSNRDNARAQSASTINSNNRSVNNNYNNNNNSNINNNYNNNNNSNINNNSNNNNNNSQNNNSNKNILKNNNKIFNMYHNKEWYKNMFNIRNYYPEEKLKNNNKFEYIEINNLNN